MLTKGILRDALTWVYQVEHSSPSHRVESSRGALGKKNRSLFASCFLFEQFLSEMFHVSWHCWTKKTNKKTLQWLLSVLVDLSSSLKSRNQKLLQIHLAVKRPQRLWNGKELLWNGIKIVELRPPTALYLPCEQSLLPSWRKTNKLIQRTDCDQYMKAPRSIETLASFQSLWECWLFQQKWRTVATDAIFIVLMYKFIGAIISKI